MLPSSADGTRGSVEGSVLLSRMAFVRQRGGDQALGRVLARLSTEDAKVLGGVMLPNDWYPFAANVHLDLAIAAEMGSGEAIFRELGAASAVDNLSSPGQRQWVSAGDPHALLKHTSAIYSIYYDTGYRRYERVSDVKAVLRTFGSQSFSREDCLTVVGWHERAVGMCGGEEATVSEVLCRARGDDHCEYVCAWR